LTAKVAASRTAANPNSVIHRQWKLWFYQFSLSHFYS
jgi:hypothetical protein